MATLIVRCADCLAEVELAIHVLYDEHGVEQWYAADPAIPELPEHVLTHDDEW